LREGEFFAFTSSALIDRDPQANPATPRRPTVPQPAKTLDLANALTSFEVAVLLAGVPQSEDHDLRSALTTGAVGGCFELGLQIDEEPAPATTIVWSADTLLARIPDLQARVDRYQANRTRLMIQLGRVLMRCAGPPGAWLQRMWARPRLVLDGRAGCVHGWEYSGLKMSRGAATLSVIRWRRDADCPPTSVHVDACRAAAERATRAREHGLNDDLTAAALDCRRSADLIASGLATLTAEGGPLIERAALAIDWVGALLIAGDPEGAVDAWTEVDRLTADLPESTRERMTAALRNRTHNQHPQHVKRVTQRPTDPGLAAFDGWLDAVLEGSQGDAAAWFARARRLAALGQFEQSRRAAAMAAAYDGDARFGRWRDADDATLTQSAQADDFSYARAHRPPEAQADFEPPKLHPLRCYAPDRGFDLIGIAGTSAANFDLDTDAIISTLETWRDRWGARVIRAEADLIDVVFDTPPTPLDPFIDRLADFCIDCFNFGEEPIRDALKRGQGLVLWWG
jgi:hypothetical protein